MSLNLPPEPPPLATGLPERPAKLFRMAWELVYHDRFRKEISVVDDQRCDAYCRKTGGFIIEAEFHRTEDRAVVRWWITVLYRAPTDERHQAYFTASICRIAPGAACEGTVGRHVTGPWESYLRTRHEHESRR